MQKVIFGYGLGLSSNQLQNGLVLSSDPTLENSRKNALPQHYHGNGCLAVTLTYLLLSTVFFRHVE